MRTCLVALFLAWVAICLWSQDSFAADSKQYELWFDAALTPDPTNAALDKENILEGDSVVIHVDPTRLFGSTTQVDSSGLVFGTTAVPPEVQAFYVTGTAGLKTPLFIQPSAAAGACVPATPVAATAPALPCSPETHGQWQTTGGQHVFTCVTDPAAPLSSLMKNPGNKWDLVQDLIVPGAPTVRKCITSYMLALGGVVDHIAATVAVGGALPDTLPAVQESGVWTLSTTLKPGTVGIALNLKRSGDAVPQVKKLSKFVVHTRDEHSLVRVQAELLTTNRARSTSFAVAISPVRREFFTDGPWSNGCIFFCAITPQALVRLSGDQTTLVQIGMGLGIYVSPPFQFNAGYLLGTKDLTTRWEPARSFYLGFAVDPFLLTEVRSTASSEGK